MTTETCRVCSQRFTADTPGNALGQLVDHAEAEHGGFRASQFSERVTLVRDAVYVSSDEDRCTAITNMRERCRNTAEHSGLCPAHVAYGLRRTIQRREGVA